MKKISKILVIADSNLRHTAALRHGRELARKADAELQICLFDFDPLIEQTADLVSTSVMQLARAQFEQQRIEWLAGEAKTMADDGIRVACDFVWSPVLYEAVVAKCLEFRPDVVLKDLPAKGQKPYDNRRSADLKLLRYCPAPLLLIHPDSPDLPKHVIAGIDVSPSPNHKTALNETVLEAALDLSFLTAADTHLAHSFPFDRPTMVTSIELRHLHAEVRLQDLERFTRFASQHDVPEDRRHALDGVPSAALSELARQLTASVLVLGSTYRSAFDRFILGSTVEQLFAEPPCDLLLIRPDDFSVALAKHLDLDRIKRDYQVTEASYASPAHQPEASHHVPSHATAAH